MFGRLEIYDEEGDEDPLVSNVDDVLKIIKLDYEKAYFVTGSLLYLLIVSNQFKQTWTWRVKTEKT